MRGIKPKLAVVAVSSLFAILASAGMVGATSDSGTTSFDNGNTITANAWIQSFSWTGCGDFSSSAVMNVPATSDITNQTSFYDIGLGSVSIKGVSIESSRESSNSLRWTNSAGVTGSYLSGTVCGGWASIYVGMDVSASSLHYGNFRIATAHI